MHVDNDAVGVAGGGGDEEVFHQPAIIGMAGLEFRHGAEIDQFGIDRLAAFQFLQQIHGPEADAFVLDIDGGAVVSLERIFGFQFDQLVGPDDLEVRAEGQHLAGDIAAHLAADDRDDPAHTVADVACRRYLADIRCDSEDIFGLQHRRHQRAIICCGSQVASSGNAIRITRRTRSVRTKGITPLKMVAKETSFTTLLMTKTFMPTGGWMRPSSTVITMMTPNQIGSKPSCITTGKMIGTVRMIIAIASIRQPSTRYITMMTASTPYLPMPRPVRNAVSFCGVCVMVRK